MDERDIGHQSANGDTEQEGTLLVQLRKEKETMEAEFGLKRAKFKELFMQKEEELQAERERREAMEESLRRLQAELDEARSLTLVAECQRENELETERRKHREELASLQHILKENTQEALRSSSRYEKEMARYKKLSEKLEQDLHELRAQQAQEREGVLAVVTKSLKQKVGNLSPNPFSSSSDNSVENLEESMRKAQEDAEMLRSLVVPLEEEIGALKDKLRSTDEQLHVYEAAFSGLVRGLGSGSLGDAIRGKSPAEVLGHLDDKLTSLCQGLQAEKASRSDLEMYVAVLNTQKTVIQEDMDRLRKELGEVCELLEREKREHGALKRTWQMANDRFLEAQQAHVRDLARLQTVLTGDQQRHLSQLRRSEAPHAGAVATLTTREGAPAAGSEGRPPQASRESSSSEQQRASPLRSGSPLPGNRFGALEPPQFARAGGRLGRADDDRMHSSPANLNVSKPPAAALLGPQEQGQHRRSLSSSDLPLRPEGVGPALGPRGRADDTQSLGGDCTSVPNTSVSLTRDQLSALSDATPEMEARKSLLEMARMEYDDVLSVGKRVVSDKEWLRLEDELQHLRERLCQPCEMCSNYEVQLQQVQRDLERHIKELAVTRQDLSHERSFRQGLEQRFADSATDVRHQVCELQERLQAAESILEEARQAQLACVSDTRYHVSQLKEHLTQLSEKNQRVEQDNHQLLGRYVVRARALQDQPINLPDSMEDLRFQYLQLQEDLIKVQLDKEKLEETLRSEIHFLRDQADAEQHCKRQLEDALSQEVHGLRRQLDELSQVKEQLEQERRCRLEKEKEKGRCELRLAQVVGEADERLHALQKAHDGLVSAKDKLEAEVLQLRGRVQTLQTELDNSEAVQRDFVKLSQSLQVELEKIRQSDSEVRWQHEDDVGECNTCKRGLHARKEKHHCSHCGKIFCIECLGKSVRSGPKMRSFPVCNVCHTLLDHDTAPYFSSEPPQTPS
uniref:Putative non-specific serine/threonine protein kinase n=1 Tax=Ixodes ricinus TaxID=34613 RepID=A0A6B0VEW5_IXORI